MQQASEDLVLIRKANEFEEFVYKRRDLNQQADKAFLVPSNGKMEM